MEKELLLLGLLRKQKMHGYRLMEFIDSNLHICTDLKKPTAYYLLEKMEGFGWVIQHEDSNGKRPAKKVYEITDLGETIFQSTLRSHLEKFEPPFFSNDTVYIFWDTIPELDRINLLQKKKSIIENEIKNLEKIPEHFGGTQILLDHQLFFLKSEQEWVEKLILKLLTNKVKQT
ncbi:MAG: hypothetical protein CVU46_06395 [Chloroflexi bacterium HGW-Chloroflexi-8]|nr:MAG: hypothetical protein CVU46_06395 [Chloroflexi bacterium HGW-Chloroflexi-8]